MAPKKILTSALIAALLVFTSSCNLPLPTANDSVVPVTSPTTESIIVQPSATQTLPLVVETPTLTSTPTLTLTFTLSVPMVSVSVETNCRTGPGNPYDIVGVLKEGETAQVVGKARYGGSWIINNPDAHGTCWLWDQYATVTGDTSSLTVLDPPATPTPVASFYFSYNFWGVGPGYQCLLFDVTNSGGSIWQSYSIFVKDLNTGVSETTSANAFTNYDNWCMNPSSQADLMPGEIGTVSGTMHMLYNPAGHSFKATLMLCPLDNLDGPCLVGTIDFIF